ncbi:cGMP-dependent protein kinase [Durusdinium trenchii]|uniref:cGMP-dependent protein kinase n=1 Tax=Durusdinium trenchii TaxID=1381693 RepID=A0ABP0PHA2_9DINO
MGIPEIVQNLRESLANWPPALQRSWRSTASTCGVGATLASTRERTTFRVLSLNLLAECKQKEEGWLPAAQEALRDWTPRRRRLLELLLQEEADLIFLQELDVDGKESALCPELREAGYSAILGDATSDCPATAVFVRNKRFAVLQQVNQDRVVVLCHHAVGHAGGSGATLGVCSAHLSSGKTPDAEEVRAQQVTKLLDSLEALGADHILLAGDLNAVPVADGKIGDPLAYWKTLSHSLSLTSAYARPQEPAYTTWKLRPKGEIKRSIDYIFHSSSLIPTALLALPSDDEMPPERLPSRNVYFLTEFVTGGELFNAIRSLGILSGVQARFYTGSLILALQALHEKKIIYRDLKPENVLLDNYGYIKLIDFGCAVRFDQGSHRSLVGTPHYMAPEVILGKEYHFSCDVWSLGVCLYEFVCGPLPFGQDCEDPRQVFQDILLSKLYFPEHFINTPGKHLLRCLLRKNSRLRIGGEHGLQDVPGRRREHAYFRKFSFTRRSPVSPARCYQTMTAEKAREVDRARAKVAKARTPVPEIQAMGQAGEALVTGHRGFVSKVAVRRAGHTSDPVDVLKQQLREAQSAHDELLQQMKVAEGTWRRCIEEAEQKAAVRVTANRRQRTPMQTMSEPRSEAAAKKELQGCKATTDRRDLRDLRGARSLASVPA